MDSSHSPADDVLAQLARLLRGRGYHFTTATPATHERVTSRPENAWATDLAGVFGWSRPFREEILPPQVLELMQDAEVIEPRGEGFRSKLRLSTLSGQLFWHSAFPTTQADAVFFGPDTYRFVRAIASGLAGRTRSVRRAVDICCGAGPGGIVTALKHPQAQVLGADINGAARRLARVNAALAGAENFQPQYSNLLSDVEGSFDFITANPPYLVDPSERAYRHGGGPLGAGLSLAIVEAAVPRLSDGGELLLYTGAAIIGGRDPFHEAILDMAQSWQTEVQMDYEEVDVDVFGEELENGAYAHCDRIAAVVLRICRH
jgi:methylase of polypeptide subunit release factors